MTRAVLGIAVFLFACCAKAGADSAELLDRLASVNGGTGAKVFVGALPPRMPNVPLPAGRIVGSISRSFKSPAPVGSEVQIYYDAEPGAFDAYGAALRAAGWKAGVTPFGMHGGFVDPGRPLFGTYCSPDGTVVTESAAPINHRDLRVSIQHRPQRETSPCDFPAAIEMLAARQTPLPDLAAPPGTKMQISPAGNPDGASGAFITGASSAQTLAESFAAQFVAAGWTRSGTAENAQIASQSFRKTDAKQQVWQAVITVYAIGSTAGSYIAFLDVTNVSALRAERGMPGTR